MTQETTPAPTHLFRVHYDEGQIDITSTDPEKAREIAKKRLDKKIIIFKVKRVWGE